MPRIPDSLLECAVYLYPDHPRAIAGESMGGSGFLFMWVDTDDPSRHQVYVVTNRHVIDDGNLTVRINTQDGYLDALDTDERSWYSPTTDSDIAICPVKLDLKHWRYRLVDNTQLLTRSVVYDFNIGVGDDCVAVGRFINSAGKQRNTPSLRFGNIAQMPGEPISIERAGKKLVQQESYLLEMRSISGFSGSPVFLHIFPNFPPPQYVGRRIDAGMWYGPWLLGVSWGYIYGDFVDVCVRKRNGDLAGTNYVAASNSGLMGVVPAWHLDDLLNQTELVQMREKRFAEEMKIKSTRTAKLTSSRHSRVPVTKTDENPAHREDFNRLVSAASKRKPKDDRT